MVRQSVKLLSLVAVLCGILAACSVTAPTTTTTSTTTTETASAVFSPTVNGIPFGILPEQLLATLQEQQIALVWPEDPSPPDFVTDPVQDGRHYNHDGSYHFTTANEMDFGYDADGTPIYISVFGTGIATAEGLKIGDSVETMKEIYGPHYHKDVDDFPVYQYYNGKEYLHIFYDEDNLVTNWNITILPYIHND